MTSTANIYSSSGPVLTESPASGGKCLAQSPLVGGSASRSPKGGLREVKGGLREVFVLTKDVRALSILKAKQSFSRTDAA